MKNARLGSQLGKMNIPQPLLKKIDSSPFLSNKQVISTKGFELWVQIGRCVVYNTVCSQVRKYIRAYAVVLHKTDAIILRVEMHIATIARIV